MIDTRFRLFGPLLGRGLAGIAATLMLASPLVHAGQPTTPVEETDLPPPDFPSRVPRDGKGALTFGGMLLSGGATSIGFGLSALLGQGGWGFGFAAVGVGAIGIGAGIGTTVMGVNRQWRFLAWQSRSNLSSPAQGNALLAAGTMTLVASVFIVTASSATWLLYEETPPSVFAGWGVSSAGFALGTALLLTGTVRRGRFERWQKAPTLLPTASFGPQGLRLGLTGTF